MNTYFKKLYQQEQFTEMEQSLFYKMAPSILNKLYANAIRSDVTQESEKFIEQSFMAMMDYLHFSKNTELNKNWLQKLVEDFKQSYQINDFRKS